MYNGKKIAVVIAAAGSGSRMSDKTRNSGNVPKQYRLCGGVPTIVLTAAVFCSLSYIDYICIATPEGDTEFCRRLCEDVYGLEGIHGYVEGGSSRQESVYKAVKSVPNDMDVVLVHDGARPLVTERVVKSVLEAACEYGGAVPGVRPKATLRTKKETLDRESIYEVQTPQGFLRKDLEEALRLAWERGESFTDEGSLMESAGKNPKLVPGDYENIKLTTPSDFPLAEAILQARRAAGTADVAAGILDVLPAAPALSDIRIGFGMDVHRLAEGRKLFLGCVEFPDFKGLLGHSDADVLAHAIADSLLGAAGLGDIGRHFPPGDESFAGISGSLILERVGALLKRENFTILNIDATLSCEKPKIAPYAEAMEKACAEALGICPGRVHIKGTTWEGLGFAGRGEGMQANAVSLILRV